MNHKQTNIVFIGGGNMTCNLVMGLLAHGNDPEQLWVTNRSAEPLKFFREHGVKVTHSNREAADQAMGRSWCAAG